MVLILLLLTSLVSSSCLPSLRYRASRTQSVQELDGIAVELYRTGFYGSSLSVYKRILQISAKEPEKYRENFDWALYEIGFCYLKLGRKNQALKFFQKVVDRSSLSEVVILSDQRIKEIQSVQDPSKSKKILPVSSDRSLINSP